MATGDLEYLRRPTSKIRGGNDVNLFSLKTSSTASNGGGLSEQPASGVGVGGWVTATADGRE